MPRRAETLCCDRTAELIEPFVDAELDAALADAVCNHVRACPECAEQLRLATSIAERLRSLPSLDMSPQALAEIRRRTHEMAQQPRWWRTVAAAILRPRPALRAAAAIAAAALVCVVTMTIMSWRVPDARSAPTQAEVARARTEARLALALIGAASRQTADDLRREVLTERVLNPTARSLGRALLATQSPQSPAPAASPAGASKGSTT